MFFEKNFQSLRQVEVTSASVLEALSHAETASNWVLVETEAKDYTLFSSGYGEDEYSQVKSQPLAQHVALHDVRGAMAEAGQIVESSCRPALNRVRLILGLGLGYVVEALFQSQTVGGPGQVFIYEPDLPRLKFLLTNVDYSAYWLSGKVKLYTALPDLLEGLRQAILPDGSDQTPLDILITSGYARVLNNEITPLMDALMSCVEERIRDYRTGLHFHWQWLQRFFQNWPYLHQMQPLMVLINQFKNYPALIIGRGPSLDTQMQALRTVPSHVILIATGSALRRLWENGITPHFAVFYDTNGLAEQLHGLPENYLENITFVLSPWVQSNAFIGPAKARVLFFPESAMAMAEWFIKNEKNWNDLNVQDCLLEGGGTVSLLAYQLALKMGCDPLILLGQDLSFPNQQAYAGGIAVQLDSAGRLHLKSTETLFAAPSDMGTVKGQNGEMLSSLQAYIGFIHHFERLALENTRCEQPRQLFNASVGGAHIEGFPCESLQQLQERGWFIENSASNQTQPSFPLTQELSTKIPQGLTLLQEQIQVLSAAYRSIIDASSTHTPPEKIQGLAQSLFKQLEAQSFLGYCLMFDMLTLQRQYDIADHTPEAASRNWALLRQTSEKCLSSLERLICEIQPR